MLALLSFRSMGQSTDPVFKRITTDQGLSHSWVRSIYQDSTGYMWIATADGLNRYDGYESKVYRYDEADSLSIGNNSIRHIAWKNTEELWIGTDNGVYIYNQFNDSFTDFEPLKGNTVRRILPQNDSVWFGTDAGLMLFDTNGLQLDHFQHDSDDSLSLSDNRIYELLSDSDRNLWVGTYVGLNLFKKESSNFTRYLSSVNTNGLSGNWVTAIVEDEQGRIWLGSPGGLDLFENAKDKPDEGFFSNVVDWYVLGLKATSHNTLWIGGGTGNGLGILDIVDFDSKKQNDPPVFRQQPFNETSLSDNSIIYLFEDQLGDMWLGTYGGGLNYFTPRRKKFEVVQRTYDPEKSISSNQVNAFFEEKQFLWIGTEMGLDQIDKRTGEWRHYCYDLGSPSSLGANAVYAIHKDKKGNLWVGTWNGGLSLFDYSDNTFEQYIPGGAGSQNVFAIDSDESNLWVGTIGGGLYQYDYSKNDFKSILVQKSDSLTISLSTSINDILFTKGGQVYISTQNQIKVLDSEQQVFEAVDLKISESKKPLYLCLMEDNVGRIWVGSNIGAFRYDSQSQEVLFISKTNGLPTSSVEAIVEDDEGNIWMSTNGGLSNVTINSGEINIVNYDKSDGLPSNEFTKRSAFKNEEGRLYFGGTKGYVSFNPEEIVENSISPQVVIGDLEITKNSREISMKELKESLQESVPIKLNYDQSDFVIRYKGINYIDPESTTYKYRLMGYEDEWQLAGSRRQATYTSLPAGVYTFQVNAANNDGFWSDEITELTLIISPAWYDRLSFKIAFYGLILALLTGAYFLRIKIYKQNQKKLEDEVRRRTQQADNLNKELKNTNEELSQINQELTDQRNELTSTLKELEITMKKLVESEKLASLGVFTAGIAHEINNPANYISGASAAAIEVISEMKGGEEVKSKDLHKLRQMHEYISTGIERLTHIISGLKNYARDDDGKFVSYNVVKCVEDALIIVANKLKVNHTVVKNYEPEIMIDCLPGRVSQIMVNLIDNAADAIDGNGTITIDIEKNDKEIEIRITDTGVGISPKYQRKLFDPFFSTKETGKGTGLGLYIVHGLVTKHGGSITFQSKRDSGTTFVVTLPVSQG